jgi:hypothetical protein
MASAVTLKAARAVVRWHYHQAAALQTCLITKAAEGWTLSAAIRSTDAFRVSQRPLVCEVPHATGVWRWPIVSLQIEGASLTATLGPKE